MRRLLPILAAPLLSACLYIPVKQTKVTSGSAPTAGELEFLSQERLRFDEVEARLGAPESNFLDIGVAVYSWKVRAGFLIVGGVAGGGGRVEQTHDLLIAYDADRRLLAHAVEKRRLIGQSAYAHASNWRAGLGVARMSSPPANDGAHDLVDIHVLVPSTTCLGIFGPYALFLDGQRVAEIKTRGAILTRAKPGGHELTTAPSRSFAGLNVRHDAAPFGIVVEAGKPAYLRLCNERSREGSRWRGTNVVTQRFQVVGREALD